MFDFHFPMLLSRPVYFTRLDLYFQQRNKFCHEKKKPQRRNKRVKSRRTFDVNGTFCILTTVPFPFNQKKKTKGSLSFSKCTNKKSWQSKQPSRKETKDAISQN